MWMLFFIFFVLTLVCVVGRCEKSNKPLHAPACDVSFESGVCLHNGQKVVLPDAKPYGLVAHIDFDSVLPLDSSGERNHAMGKALAAAGFGGIGSSGFFRQTYIIIPHSTSLASSDFSYTFFLYLLNDATSRSRNSLHSQYCPIVHKGVMSEGAEEATPAILYNPNNGRIKIVVSTTATISSAGEEMESNSKLRPHQWYHIAVIRRINIIRLYVDGVLDSSFNTEGATRINDLPIYIGTAPYAEDVCDTPLLIDELRIYNTGIGRDQVQAEASAATSGIEPSFIHIGCIDCEKEKAKSSCPEGYHLCSKLELYMGAFKFARKVSLDGNIMHVDTGGPSRGLGLCCSDATS